MSSQPWGRAGRSGLKWSYVRRAVIWHFQTWSLLLQVVLPPRKELPSQMSYRNKPIAQSPWATVVGCQTRTGEPHALHRVVQINMGERKTNMRHYNHH